MKHHEREFFVSIVRNGKLKIKKNNIILYIYPPTVEQILDSCAVYNEFYDKFYSEEMMTEDDMNSWMKDNGIWTLYDDNLEEKNKKNVEELKIEIFNMRNEPKKINKIRSLLREAEHKLTTHSHKKYSYYQNTCEGLAGVEKLSWLIKNTTYYNNKLYDFNDLSLQYVTDEWQSSFLSDTKLRNIARNDPWKSLWVIRENSNSPLFFNPPNSELTHNQKNLLIWSQMYDNIQESIDCPTKNVIEDDDMLDGWFIIQNRKREVESLNKDFEEQTKNEKIKNSSEVFVMTSDQKRIQNIEEMNSESARSVKRQRLAAIRKHDHVLEQELPDQKMNIEIQKRSINKRG